MLLVLLLWTNRNIAWGYHSSSDYLINYAIAIIIKAVQISEARDVCLHCIVAIRIVCNITFRLPAWWLSYRKLPKPSASASHHVVRVQEEQMVMCLFRSWYWWCRCLQSEMKFLWQRELPGDWWVDAEDVTLNHAVSISIGFNKVCRSLRTFRLSLLLRSIHRLASEWRRTHSILCPTSYCSILNFRRHRV